MQTRLRWRLPLRNITLRVRRRARFDYRREGVEGGVQVVGSEHDGRGEW